MPNMKDLFSRFKAPGKVGKSLASLPLNHLFSGKKQLVGLDIGSSSLKLAEIEENKGGYILNHFSQIPLEKGVIDDGVLSDPGALTEKIKTLFKGTGLNRKGIVTSLSGHSSIIKKVTLPSMEDVELRELIRDEASKYLPFDNMDNVNFDFQVLGPNEFNPNQMEVILVAAKKEAVEGFTDAIESAGLSAFIMDVDTFALETMYEANYDFEEDHIVAMINIGASITNINVVKGSVSLFTRDFTLAGNALTEMIQTNHTLNFEAAEKMKIEGPEGDSMTRKSFRDSLLGYADPLCTEIERSIDYFKSISGGENIKKVLLSGGTANIPGLAESLTQRLSIETELVDPFRKIDYNRKSLTPEEMKAIGSTAAVAIGLALRKIGDK
jgi:type IV pilus assembly protein PilM